MERGYGKGVDLYCKVMTNHYHYKYFPHNHPLGHKSLEKDAPTVTPLAPSQTTLQKNLEECVHDNFQIEHQQFPLKIMR